MAHGYTSTTADSARSLCWCFHIAHSEWTCFYNVNILQLFVEPGAGTGISFYLQINVKSFLISFKIFSPPFPSLNPFPCPHPFFSSFILAVFKWQKLTKHHMIYCKQYAEDFWSIYTLSFRYSSMFWISVLLQLDTKEYTPRSNSFLFQINCLWNSNAVNEEIQEKVIFWGFFHQRLSISPSLCSTHGAFPHLKQIFIFHCSTYLALFMLIFALFFLVKCQHSTS